MKTIHPNYSLILILLCLLFAHCKSKKKNDPQPTPTQAEKVTALMTANIWSMQSLTIDGVSDNTFFQGLTVVFTNSGFTAKNGDPVWPATGTWAFTDDTAQSFKRDDGTVVSITNISDTALKLTLEWTKTTTSGRTLSVSGKHVFTFTK